MQTQLPTVLALALLAGCGGGGMGTASVSTPAAVPAVSYFPLEPGLVRIYDGEHDGLPVREEVTTLRSPRTIAGVACIGEQTLVWVDGVLTEFAVEWFARDLFGNVWKFGEDTRERARGFNPSADSWLAGQRGGEAWIAMPVDLQPGLEFTGYRPRGSDTFVVESTTETVELDAGVFTDCARIVENPNEPDDRDILLFAPGVGRVVEETSSGYIVLSAVRRP
ncbi:MAG: hypothetical protein KDE27_29000 [Planctomycetes bacterium]|nr:hypothetical protein [Planctomycetota bacterium]